MRISCRLFMAGKDPSTFAILFEDGAALAGLVIAFAGLLLAQILRKPFPDAIASIGIALILMIAAALLGTEARGLRVYMRRHSVDRSSPSHRATKIDLFDEVHRQCGQAALWGRQVILVPEGCRQTLNS